MARHLVGENCKKVERDIGGEGTCSSGMSLLLLHRWFHHHSSPPSDFLRFFGKRRKSLFFLFYVQTDSFYKLDSSTIESGSRGPWNAAVERNERRNPRLICTVTPTPNPSPKSI